MNGSVMKKCYIVAKICNLNKAFVNFDKNSCFYD